MIGRTVSHYKIIEELGRGGMGVVYRAEDTRLGRDVALKFLPGEFTSDAEAKARFVQEARAASALDHPNICTVYEIDETDDGRSFIAMAYYQGETLRSRINRGVIDIEDAADVGIGICRGLSMAHSKGIVHRDIKPSNILITDEGEAKIVDFGLAKLSTGKKLTRTGLTMGTVSYMSPEHVSGKKVDHLTDIWSLGVVLYEMLTGLPPFTGEYQQSVMYAITHEEPKKLRSIRKDISPELERIVMKTLQKDKGSRYQSAEEIIRHLESFLDKEGVVEKGDFSRAETSIAVLPFVNMSPDADSDYFGDGLAEELINALAQLKGLRVVARTSAFRFRGRGTDIREIGRQLSVGSILEGSVRKSGSKLRITAQLIDVDDGYHIWSDRYDREMEDIFSIQDEIARAIVEKLQVTFDLEPGESLVKKTTDNLEAYNLYLKGLYNWNLMTPESWAASRECFEKAVAIDPDFAPAYAGLAIWHQSQAYWGEVPPMEAYRRSMENAEKALDIDETMAVAHDVLACNYFLYDRNWPASESEFKRALELDPTSTITRANYGLHLVMNNRISDALEQPKIAKRYDPLSILVNAWGALILNYAGHTEEAIDQLKETIDMEPSHWQPHYHLATLYMEKSDLEKAIAEAEKAVELSGGSSSSLMIDSSLHFLLGREDEGRVLLDRLKKRAEESYVPPVFFAWISMARGDPPRACRYVEKAIKMRDAWLNFNFIYPPQIKARSPEIDELLQESGYGGKE
jgi:TolB-like protein/Tfp pilus assembly protein PilF